MSHHDCPQAAAEAAELAHVEQIIVPRSSDIGGFEVRRALPARERRMVGPFVFFDQMGPNDFEPGRGLDVRPHPHIGLATVTYLFTGAMSHRDSLGTVQTIEPGAVNWMTAGRGIAHSERTPPELRPDGSRLSGIQAWVALPQSVEETGPDFTHIAQDDLPEIEADGARIRLLTGEAFGARSPVKTASETLYADVRLQAGSRLAIDSRVAERAIYLVEGELIIDGQRWEAGRLLVLKDEPGLVVQAARDSRFMLLGGEPMDGPRHIWWNFVSSRRDRIEQAKEDWRAGRFDQVIGEHEFIPLPE